MNKVFSKIYPLKIGFRRYLSTNTDIEYINISNNINKYVNRITSLWGMRNIKIKDSKYFKDDLILKLASKHLSQIEVDNLLSLSPKNKTGKLPTANTYKKIIYEENINNDINLIDNDIWLGYCKYISFINLNLKYKSKNFKHFLNIDKINNNNINNNNKIIESQNIYINNEENYDEIYNIINESDNIQNYTIFIFPYLRKTSKIILESLNLNRQLFSRSDLMSLVYTCGSTGSSRLLRFLVNMLNENFSMFHSDSSIYKVETHAWPWMCKSKYDGKQLCYDLPILLDALCSCSIIRYSIENERNIYDYIITNLKILDSKIQLLNEKNDNISDSNDLCNRNQELEKIIEYDNIILEKVLSLLIIKRNIDKLGNDQIRAFSDFVCDRLHRIKPKVLANIAFLLGHSQNLDEFWMFMISKQIQTIINNKLGISSKTNNSQHAGSDYIGEIPSSCEVSNDDMSSTNQESKHSNECKYINNNENVENVNNINIENGDKVEDKDTKKELNNKRLVLKQNKKTSNLDEFDMDDITAILDAYSNAGLEDYSFYSTICKSIEKDFHNYTLQHKSVVVRSLAKVRHRDQNMLNDYMESIKNYAGNLESYVNESKYINKDKYIESYTKGLKIDNKPKWLETVKAHMIKPIDTYIVASAILSACDMEYKGDGMDSLWKIITLKVKDASFDICAVSWLPIATITFPSIVSLTEFLPVWLNHVSHTMNKLKSRTYMMTLQRRQLLLRHAFNLGILPSKFLEPKSKKILDDLCNRNYITCKDDYIPESSTFHLEVCASLRGIGVTHQREINVIPFVMDIVISPDVFNIKSSLISEAQRASDLVRSGNIDLEGDLECFPLKYTRNSPNHRKHKEEVYTMLPKQ